MNQNPLETLSNHYRNLFKDLTENNNPSGIIKNILTYQQDLEYTTYMEAVGKLSIRQIGTNSTFAELYIEAQHRLTKILPALNPLLIKSPKVRKKLLEENIPEIISILECINMSKDALENITMKP